jgi:hypothetical protein
MRQKAPTAAASSGRGKAQHEAVLAYYPGEHPAWKEVNNSGPQQAPASTNQPTEFTPLAELLHGTSPDTLSEVRRRVVQLDRTDLIERYRTAYADGKRLVAHIMAGELIERGIPPCFLARGDFAGWHHSGSA